VIRGPFDSISPGRRRAAALVLAAAVAGQLRMFLTLERRMRRAGGPGIIAFELAGTPERARDMLDAWGADGRAAARRSLWLDFPFPATYAPLQALACTAAAERFRGLTGHDRAAAAAAAAGPILAWSQLAAALFDYVENASLLLVLGGRADGRLPALARRAAVTKFVLLYAGWGYVLASRLARPRS
jgi:hypothetical protein